MRRALSRCASGPCGLGKWRSPAESFPRALPAAAQSVLPAISSLRFRTTKTIQTSLAGKAKSSPRSSRKSPGLAMASILPLWGMVTQSPRILRWLVLTMRVCNKSSSKSAMSSRQPGTSTGIWPLFAAVAAKFEAHPRQKSSVGPRSRPQNKSRGIFT